MDIIHLGVGVGVGAVWSIIGFLDATTKKKDGVNFDMRKFSKGLICGAMAGGIYSILNPSLALAEMLTAIATGTVAFTKIYNIVRNVRI